MLAELRAARAGVAGLHACEASGAATHGLSDNPAKRHWTAGAALAAALLAPAAWAQAPSDPLKSPACAEALAGLQAARNVAAPAQQVETLRSAAAATCLGAGIPPSRPSRVAQQPIAVPPPQVEAPPRAAGPAGPALPPPPVAIERVPGPALCDATGCWTPDGPRLRMVPSLPGAPCTVRGTVTSCP